MVAGMGSMGGGDRTRMFGMASGMDVDQMVDKLMKAEKMPLQTMKQDKQVMEWRRDEYRDMNKLMTELKDTTFDMSLERSYLTKTTTSSNESLVTASASTNASDTSYTIANVTKATAAYNSSASSISGSQDDKIDLTASLSSQKDKFDQPLTFDSDGTFSFDVTTYNDDGENSKIFTFEGSDSLNDVLKTVNNSDLDVNMFYDTASDKVSITRTKTGNFHGGAPSSGSIGADANTSAAGDAEIQFTGFMKEQLKLDGSNEQSGSDAAFTINGLETTNHKNNFTVDGMTFNLKQNFTAPVSVSSSTDVDAVFNKVKDWVDKYNEVIEKVNDKTSEKRYRNYKPLTDKQQEEMTDREIELWMEKAKSGMLSQDHILSSGLTKMRMDLYSEVSGTSNPDYNQLSEIGIQTSDNYRENGKLILTESKLKAAIADDPNAVMELFTNHSENSDEQGIMQRMDETISNTTAQIENKAGNTGMETSQFSIGKRLEDMNERIDDFQDHLTDVQDRYYRQFTAMEQAIQRANQQSAYISQNFS
ncbi:flagellar hook-associated protein 2 [Tuberibacillus sp. Marseille-P3662]|uniref:flagellar hook-associated protein 2 n=1 Tax=Tuberibacillus sp. Marseille-P3662 TaxID=1965358 RepID=UPI000A1CA1F6|nr:flagellar hook-associated protein 2 [Tuberibacillus sp. Marseille-P3662]